MVIKYYTEINIINWFYCNYNINYIYKLYMATDENNDSGQDKNNDSGQNKKNKWGEFTIYVLIILSSVLGIAVFGANFVYFTRINLDAMFPSDQVKAPYTDNGPPASSSKPDSCGTYIDFMSSITGLNNKYISSIFEYGFPYYTTTTTTSDSTWTKFRKWMSNKITYSYVWQRVVIKNIIQILGSTCSMAPSSMKDIVPFILGPICIGIIILITSLWWIPSFVSFFYNEDQSWFGWITTLIGMIFPWTWVLIACLFVVQILGVLFTFTLLPLILNSKEIIGTVGESYNSFYLLLLLLSAFTVAAFINLNLWTSVPMLLVFLYSLWTTRPWKKDSSTATSPKV